MDTAQRGMGLDWPASLELIRRSLDAARDIDGAAIACGCGTAHVATADLASLADVINAYEEQEEATAAAGGRVILMATRAIAAFSPSPPDYATILSPLH